MGATRLATSMLVLTTLTACSASSEPASQAISEATSQTTSEPTSQATATPTTTPLYGDRPDSDGPPPDTSPEAGRSAYQDALDALLEADTGRFSSSVGTHLYGAKVGGGYALSSRRAAVDTVYGDANGQVAGASVWLGDQGFLRRFTGEDEGEGLFADPCWTAYTTGPNTAAEHPMRATQLGFPAALEVLLSARGFIRTGSRIRAEADLHLIARAFGPRMARALRIPARGGGRGTIIVDTEDGLITGWSTTTANFLTEVEKAGYTLPPEFADFEDLAQSSGSANVTLTEAGEAHDLDLPPDSPVC